MILGSDLRGRAFGWSVERGGEIAVLEEGEEVARMAPATGAGRVWYATFGQRLRIELAASVVGPTFCVTDPDRGTLVAQSRYGPDLAPSAIFDAPRAYALRRGSGSAAWQDASGDVVAFRPAGSAYVLMGADPADAPALLLIGVAMAVEHALFTA